VATWSLIPAPTVVIPAEVDVSPLDRAVKIQREAHLGYGLLRPFVRDEKNDFANAGGVALIKSSVGQILGTRCASDFSQGELPWNTEFGSLLYLLRHQKNDIALQALARTYVAEALARWEPRIQLRTVEATRESTPTGGENVLSIRITYDVISTNVPGNQVYLPDVTQEVTV
jgi:phage baseplate assembly protein W